jgi:curved DNA-binding protein CbpA
LEPTVSKRRNNTEQILDFEEQDYYDLLEVDYQAPPADIKRSYQFALKSFGASSMASYSLFSQQERERILNRVDEAYKTLIDIQKRKKYDEELIRERKWPKEFLGKGKTAAKEIRREIKAPVEIPEHQPLSEEKKKLLASLILSVESEMGYDGAALKKIREIKGISLDEVALRTKISKNHLKYIEEDQYGFLPPEVYVKGFITQVAKILDLKPDKVVTSFVECMRSKPEK